MIDMDNPSEYYVSVLYSGGFHFKPNKDKLKYLYLFCAINDKTKYKWAKRTPYC